MSDPFGHRKYHGLYFILGLLIAFIVVPMLAGCEQATSTAGVEIERCAVGYPDCDDVVIVLPPTDPPGCWYPGNTEYCEPEPPVCCQALIPSCMACADSCTVDAWLEKTCGPDAIDAEYAGWDNASNEPLWLCQAEIIN